MSNTTNTNTTTETKTAKTDKGQQQHEQTTVRATTDRERPIENGRESSREADQNRTGVIRQRDAGTRLGGMHSPFNLMNRMAEDMDRLFEQFGFGRSGFGLTPRFGSLLEDSAWSDLGSQQNAIWAPQVETFRRGDELVIRADIPGVKKEDVHVHIENDTLTISGERRHEHEENRGGFYRSERSYGQFYRAIPLPDGVNADRCNASFSDGVLEVTLPAPNQEERRAKRIQIR